MTSASCATPTRTPASWRPTSPWSPTASVARPPARSPRPPRRTPSRRPSCSAPASIRDASSAEAFAAARDIVRLGVQRDLNRLGMATTLTVLVTDGRSVVLGHVGDSRAYLLRAGELRQITTDHTYVQHLVETGRLSDQARATHPWRNVVLRSLDGDPEGSAARHHSARRADRRPADDLQRRADRPGRRRADRRGPALGGPRGGCGRADRGRAGRRRPRQHHLRGRGRDRRAARGRRRPAPRRGL